MTTKISEIIRIQELQTNSQGISLKESQELITKNSNDLAISLYRDSPVTHDEIASNMAKLKISFPKMESTFFNVLTERIIANNFTGKRLKDSVNHIIDNFQYKELVVSDIIRFDKRVKLYTYNDVCNLVTKNHASFSDFEIREIDGTHYRIKKTDML